MQALRKPLETDVGITAPRICVETITPSLVSIIEVSQASHIQEEDITPLYYFKCLWIDFSIRLQKYNNFLIEVLYLVQYLQIRMATLERVAILQYTNQKDYSLDQSILDMRM